ncbi:FUSC family protein [Pontimicrobium sp. MEBiC06410]
MKKLFIILGVITGVLAVVLSVLPTFKLAFIPATLTFIFGLLAFWKAKKESGAKHTVQLIFLFSIIALSLATYKTIFETNEVGDIEQLEKREEKSLENSIEELDEELEDIDIDE